MAEPNIVDLCKRLLPAVNGLVRESDLRSVNSLSSEDEIAFVPFVEFETKVVAVMRPDSSMGWQKEFERQSGFTEGTVKRWKHAGKVPYGAVFFCKSLKPMTDQSVKLKWSDDELALLDQLVATETPIAEMRHAMNVRFGDRRDYMASGTLDGAVRRARQRLAQRSEEPVHSGKFRIVR